MSTAESRLRLAELAGARSVQLPTGSSLVVRPMVPLDVEGLMSLYAGLSLDDLHLRFFSAYHPPRRFFEDMADAAAEGRGFGLVAAVDGAAEQIVAEADYVLLDNGDGELSITVARDWRGWLGPYLLDALLDSAAALGVRNLEAEILVENHRMMALVRSRGYVTLDHSNFTVVRVAVGTATRTPVWFGSHQRPRVLVEAAGGRWRGEEAARKSGFDVVVCPGPRPGPDAHCPALEGGRCPLVTGADLIVFALSSENDNAHRLLSAHDRVHPGSKICVDEHAGPWPPFVLPAGAVVLDPGIDEGGVMAALRVLTGTDAVGDDAGSQEEAPTAPAR